jgi:Tol biopolymer transport system component
MKIKSIKSIAVVSSIAILGALVSISGIARQADDPGVMLRAAIEKEEVDGDLQGAIELYKQVVAKYADNRAIAAKALLRLGGCYEKLGREDARKTYQQLLSQYADQEEIARQARSRLAALATTVSESVQKPILQKIRIPTKLPMRGSGMLSPDGQKLAFISEGAIWVMPIHGKTDPNIAGPPVRLTEPMRAWDVVNVSIAWSSDGKWIGFRTGNPGKSLNPVEGHYIISAEGGKPERLPITWKDWAYDVYTVRCALSADAETLFFADGSPEELRIYSMPARGGERRPLTEPITREPALSPDGSKIAYVKVQKRPDSIHFDTRQVWMRPVYGGDPVLICEVPTPAQIWSPVWSPDGTMIAFIFSEGPGGDRHQQIWVVPLSADGRPAAPPSKFDLPGQTGNLLAGWTRDNTIGILIPTPQLVALYTVPAEGGKATQLTTEYTAMPRWTPDGTRIYFDGAHGGARANLEYMPAEGGKVTRLPVVPDNIQPVFPSQLSISPDGRTLCYAGFYRSGSQDPGPYLFIVPVEGGTATRVAIEPTTDKYSDFGTPEWSPDGTEIAFLRHTEAEPGSETLNIYVVRREGGEPRQVSTGADKVQRGNLAWSPDGEVIGFFGEDGTLRLIPAAGGSSRILGPAESGPWSGIAWSPDGKRIAYTTGEGLHVVSRAGGDPKTIATGLDARHLQVDWSPDGKRIAFTASSGGEPDLWLIEDFLPRPAAAKKAPQGLTIRKVYEGGGNSVSPDGRYVSFADEYNLAVRDLTTGKTRRLTNAGSIESRVFADHSIFSPDGRQIVYEWFNGDWTWDLRLVGLDGSGPRVLIHRDNNDDIYPCGWSSDGKRILTCLFRMAGPGSLTGEIAFVSVADGKVEVVKPTHETNFSTIRWMHLSPDGRYIAYHAAAGGAKQNDLFLLSSDGSSDVPLLEHPANDRCPVWTPDGKRILFISDRAGAPGFWMIDVVDGKPRGEPRLVKPDIGDIGPALGLTRDGAYYYLQSVEIADIYVADLNPAIGRIQGKPQALASRFARKLEPVWSPDGQHLAFIRRTGPNSWVPGWRTIIIRDNRTGEERELANDLILSGWVRWFPDSRALLASAMRGEKDRRIDFYRVDVETGETSLLLKREDGAGSFWPGLSPDGETIFFTFYKGEWGDRYRGPGDCFLASYEIETAKEKELCHVLPRGQRERQSIAISPDGRQLAFVVHEGSAEGESAALPGSWPITSVVKLVSSEGGEPRELFRSPWPGYIPGNRGLEWTPDGRYLLVVRGSMSTEIGELLRIPAQGGEPQAIGLAAKSLTSPSVRPDGKKIAFHAVSEASNEIWVMENFLKPAK